jgi:hypothetical protein
VPRNFFAPPPELLKTEETRLRSSGGRSGMERTSADENCLVSSIFFLVASSEEMSWEAGGVVEELRLACCSVAEGPRLAVALSRGRVLLVAEQGQCVLCVNRAESKY